MPLILLKSSGTSTAVLSRRGAVWGRLYVLQPTAPYLGVPQHSGGFTSCTHQHEEGGRCGNILPVNLPFFLASLFCWHSQAAVPLGSVPPFPSTYVQEGVL